jgi:hypothetical protein
MTLSKRLRLDTTRLVYLFYIHLKLERCRPPTGAWPTSGVRSTKERCTEVNVKMEWLVAFEENPAGSKGGPAAISGGADIMNARYRDWWQVCSNK